MKVGSAPDSWGVWFASDARQVPWERFLEEAAAVGYEWIELGPYGYLPTEAVRLARELERRQVRPAGTFVSFDFEDPQGWTENAEEVELTCRLLQDLGAPNLILIDGIYTDLHTGAERSPRTLDDRGWAQLVESTRRLQDVAAQHGLHAVFHPHADTHVEREEHIERLLEDVPDLNLCLDVGHFAYSDGGDPVTFFRRHHDRIDHLHLKSVDPALAARVRREQIPFAQAVAAGMFVEPWRGAVDFVALRDALTETGYDGFAIAEQDMYPADFDRPLPIAQSTFASFKELGLV
ncbi:MAG: sugar phosphate isomerase/epimerase family protein [Solirubrobacteraceae bacterium]